MTSEKGSSKLSYWAKRLECPVDENATYHNTFVSLSITYSPVSYLLTVLDLS